MGELPPTADDYPDLSGSSADSGSWQPDHGHWRHARIISHYHSSAACSDTGILNEEKMYFEILENGEVVKATMENQKIEMPKTFNTELTSTIIIISTALLGIGLLIYEKKKNK